MLVALAAAARAARRGEIPVGAVVVSGGVRLSTASNRTISGKDPSAHAEIVALRRAARRTGNHRLVGTTLYVTLEPCVMCLGAIVQARVDRLVFAADDPKSGAIDMLADRRWQRRLNHRFAVTRGVLERDASERLKEFFRERRGRKTH